MKGIRLIVRTEDFGAVSQALIGLGVGFSVEPAEETGEVAAPQPETTPVLKRRAGRKAAAKPAARKLPARDEILLTGADRLRSALARKPAGITPSSPAAETGELVRSPSGENGM